MARSTARGVSSRTLTAFLVAALTVGLAPAEASYAGAQRSAEGHAAIAPAAVGPSVVDLASSSHPLQTLFYADSTPSFTWSASEPAAGYSWSLDQVALGVPDDTIDGAAGSATVSASNDGTWYFHVSACDGAANWGAPSHYTVNVDTEDPTGSISVNGGAAVTGSTAVTVSTAGVSDLSPLEVRWSTDGGVTWSPFEPMPDTKDVTLPGGNGTRTVSGRVSDEAGHVVTFVDDILLDTADPLIDAVTSPTHPNEANYYESHDPTFLVETSDFGGSGVTGYSWVIDASTSAEPDTVVDGASATIALTGIADGVWYLRVRAQDAVGHWSATAMRTVRIGDAPTLTRIKGDDRYGTALAVSQADFAAADTVIVATGANFADALAGAGLAGCYEAPLLLTPPNRLASGILGEIGRLGATRVIILGGPAAVSSGVENALKAPGRTVTRIKGTDRYGTSAAIARAIAAHQGASFAREAFVARGDNFADALASSPLVYARRMPILLVKPDSMPGATASILGELDLTRAYVAGGTAAVSDAVAGKLGVAYDRFGGADRYSTAALVAKAGVSRGWATWDHVGIATGENFPDALGGGVGMGARGGVLLLTKTSGLPGPTRQALEAQRQSIAGIDIFGGASAVSEGARSEVGAALQ